MRAYDHEPLSKHTTLNIGGPARRFLIPESPQELIDAVTTCRRRRTPYVVLGRGSNVLVSDRPLKKVVIKNTEACRHLAQPEPHIVEAGSSVPLQELIRFCVERDLYGMEYLSSVPGNVGGAIAMNAGRGLVAHAAISEYLESVEVFDGVARRTVTKAEGQFAYRASVFQRRPWVILGARFRLPAQPRAVGEAEIAERMALARERQDYSGPNAGSVFGRHFPFAKAMMGRRIHGAKFSDKTPNWIVNTGHARFRDVTRLIALAQWHHVLRGRRMPELEWVIVR